MSFHHRKYPVFFTLVFLLFVSGPVAGNFNLAKDIVRQTKLAPCRACKLYVNSFSKGMERTKRNKFDGGDAAWEEEKLSTYENSEVRLTEIQEQLCSDIEEGREQCYTNNEEWDSIVEEWWTKKDRGDLYESLCVNEVKVCCPAEHYGPTCLPCPGQTAGRVCSDHGRCRGAGTRKGNGQCQCDGGYAGGMCDMCAGAHFETYRAKVEDGGHVLCSACHAACAGNCTGPGPAACEDCADGWTWTDVPTTDADRTVSTRTCIDIDECATGPKRRCKLNQFCVNTAGSYQCLACDGSCAGCTGDGPDLCLRCGDGYERRDGLCVESNSEGRRRWVVTTRYLTYAGLCLTTCIIFQRSVLVAAIIGLLVAVYISMSEYVLSQPGMPNTTNIAEQLMAKQITN